MATTLQRQNGGHCCLITVIIYIIVIYNNIIIVYGIIIVIIIIMKIMIEMGLITPVVVYAGKLSSTTPQTVQTYQRLSQGRAHRAAAGRSFSESLRNIDGWLY